MKKYKTYRALLCFGIMLQTFAQAGLVNASQQLFASNSIKDELLHLYNTEPQLCEPYFSSKAHSMLELQKIPSSSFLSWIKNYINSYIQPSYFRVTPEKAPHTIAYLKEITKNMGIDQVPDLYLGQNAWNPYNAVTGSLFLEKTNDWFHFFINSAINDAIVTNAEDEWKMPILTLRYLLPATAAVLFKKLANTADQIVIYDKKMIEALSENSVRAMLAHEAGHIKNNDYTMNYIIWNLSMCVTYSGVYYSMTNSSATTSFSHFLSPIYVLLHQVTKQFNIDLLRGHNGKAINGNLVQSLIITLCAENLHNLLNTQRSRYIEYRADLEAAYVVGFENMIKIHEEMQRFLEKNTERDFSLIPSSDYAAANFLIWLLKKSEQFEEWKTLNSPFRSHPTHQQRIDYLKQKYTEAQQASIPQ